MTAPRDREDGSASVWLLALSMVVVALIAASTVVMAALTTRTRAASAADLAALAAAGHALDGPAAACVVARRIAEANGARLLHCQVRDAVADVVAVVTLRWPGPGWQGLGWPAAVRSRAGPADGPRPP